MSNHASRKAPLTWSEGYKDGVLSALTVLTYRGDADSTEYREIVQACGADELVAYARKVGDMRRSGLDKYVRANRNAPLTAHQRETE